MVTTMTLEQMVTTYNRLSAASAYIVGFTHRHQLYYVFLNGHLPMDMLKLDRTSAKRGAIAKVRVRIASALRKGMIENGTAILMGDASLLETDDHYNRGERFERLITETLTHTAWVKDSIPFNVAGDIELNGQQVQIKFDAAELTNEKTLTRMTA